MWRFPRALRRLLVWLLGCIVVSLGVSLILLVAISYYMIVMPMAGHTLARDIAETAVTLTLVAHILLAYFFAVVTPPGCPPTHAEVAQAIETGKFNEIFPGLEPPFVVCKKCQRIRTDRTHHCSVCGVCVLRMDHHCPWLAQCVGQNNYKHFVQLLFWLTTGSLYGAVLLGPTVYRHILAKRDKEWPGSITSLQIVLFSGLLCICIGCAVGGLAAFHFWLLFKGMTTIEFRAALGSGGNCGSTLATRGVPGQALNNFRAVMGPGPSLLVLSPFYESSLGVRRPPQTASYVPLRFRLPVHNSPLDAFRVSRRRD